MLRCSLGLCTTPGSLATYKKQFCSVSPPSPRGPAPADGSSPRALRDRGGRPSHDPSTEELPAAWSQEGNTAQLWIPLNHTAPLGSKQRNVLKVDVAEAGGSMERPVLGRDACRAYGGASLSSHQPLMPVHGEDGVVQRGGEGGDQTRPSMCPWAPGTVHRFPGDGSLLQME